MTVDAFVFWALQDHQMIKCDVSLEVMALSREQFRVVHSAFGGRDGPSRGSLYCEYSSECPSLYPLESRTSFIDSYIIGNSSQLKDTQNEKQFESMKAGTSLINLNGESMTPQL